MTVLYNNFDYLFYQNLLPGQLVLNDFCKKSYVALILSRTTRTTKISYLVIEIHAETLIKETSFETNSDLLCNIT